MVTARSAAPRSSPRRAGSPPCSRTLLFTPGDSVPLDAIDTSNPEGAKLASSARQIITYLGLGERKDISVADMADLTKLYSPEYFNGDGIIPVAVAPNDELRAVIQAIIDAGNAGMATAGMGDVLAGLAGALGYSAAAQGAGIAEDATGAELVLNWV